MIEVERPLSGSRLLRLMRERDQKSFSTFVAKGGLVFDTPIQDVLAGFCVEGSQWWPGERYVWAYVQPLFAPTWATTLTFGKRMGGGTRTWKLAEFDELYQYVQRDGMPILESLGSVELLAKNGGRFLGGQPTLAPLEDIAYSQVLAGRLKEALRTFGAMRADLLADPDDRPWVQELMARAALIEQLMAEDPMAAVRQLREWRQYTIENLKLTKWAADL